MIPKNKILITGATGWLGRALLEGLIYGIGDIDCGTQKITKNSKARVLVSPKDNVRVLDKYKDWIDVVIGDVTNLNECKIFFLNASQSTLYHTAGVIHPKKTSCFYAINHQGTLNILNAAKEAGIKKAIVMSSNSPIGCNIKKNSFFDELSPFNPYMHYGKSKMLMEQDIIELQKSTNMEITRIRAPWFYGPFQPKRQIIFFKMIASGKFPLIGDGKNKRSMVYIGNLVQGLILAALSDGKNKLYWIADEEAYTMNFIVKTINDVMRNDFGFKTKKNTIKLPSFLGDIAYFLDKTIQAFGFYNQKIHVLSEMNKNITCSILLAKKELGYKPSISLREGMIRSIRSAISNRDFD
jgi:nucleoside-diphosphate-sugar epimerase